MSIGCNTTYLNRFVSDNACAAALSRAGEAQRLLHAKTGAGSEFLGWLELPTQYDREEFLRIQAAAARIRETSDVLVVIGIGGSYLGARAVIEALRSRFHNQLPDSGLQIYFAGNTLSPASLNQLLRLCEGKELSVNVVSKSGGTLEPAIAFRAFRERLEQQYGKAEARRRIYCTTDRERGALKTLADREGYSCFVVPDDIGGRYSVLTAVGLLPIAAAGCDIKALMRGAADAQQAYAVCDPASNDCCCYAAARHLMLGLGKQVEVLTAYEPDLSLFTEWYKQLFGESEGKNGKGLFPASMIFSTDLHSLGQFVQDGAPILFETVLHVAQSESDHTIHPEASDFDGLNFLSGQPLSAVNHKAFQGTLLAHLEGGAPNIVLELPRLDEYELGFLIYFFEKACAISGYMLGVNPFDQPGVEAYKANIFALLGKPGLEAQRAALEANL